MRYVVSENVEIILDGHLYLLEAGDIIVLEAYVDLERVYDEIAENVASNFEISSHDIDLIREGLYGEISDFEPIKNFVKIHIKNDPDINFKVTDNVIRDILERLVHQKAPSEDWKQMPATPSPEKRAFRGEKEKLAREKALEQERLHQMFNQ